MELDYKDYRIGNFLETSDGWVEVVEISEQHIKTRPYPHIKERRIHNDAEPIPLTKEISERLGFKFHENGLWGSYQHKSPLAISFEYGAWKMRQDQGYIGTRGMKYVHQLQNLFYDLSGSELTLDGNRI